MRRARAAVYPRLFTLMICGSASLRCTKAPEPVADAAVIEAEPSVTAGTPSTAEGVADPQAPAHLSPGSSPPPPTHAWPLLPVVFAPRAPLADDLTLTLRARRGAVVHAVHAGRVVRVSDAEDPDADAPPGPASNNAGVLTVKIISEDGLQISYLGMQEALVRPGVRVASGAPVGIMNSSASGTLQIRASQDDTRVAPLSLLGH